MHATYFALGNEPSAYIIYGYPYFSEQYTNSSASWACPDFQNGKSGVISAAAMGLQYSSDTHLISDQESDMSLYVVSPLAMKDLVPWQNAPSHSAHEWLRRSIICG